jgi:hypothetical protein
MKIRQEQMEAFAVDGLAKFEEDMLVHFKGFAPKHYEVIGERGTREVIRLGMERSRSYQLTRRGAVRFYIELMFMFGSDFDTDPQLPWAAETLNDLSVPYDIDRAEILFDRTTEYLTITAGEKNVFAIKSVHLLKNVEPEDYPLAGPSFTNEVLALLRSVYPQKFDYVGEVVYRDLIHRASVLAEQHFCGVHEGGFIFTAAMFAMGHGFASDPLFPWVRATLNDPLILDPAQRVRRLVSKMKTYLDAVLKYLDTKTLD